MRLNRKGSVLGALAALGLSATAALASEPLPWQMGLQPAATNVMQDLVTLHDGLLILITLISLFVLALLLYVVVRFNEKSNPVPSKTTHNTLIEVLWTVVPIMVLVAIAVPSFRLLYFADRSANPEMTLKAIGHQWYWSYEYPDHDNLTFDARIIRDEDLKPGQKRLLDTDNRVVLPVDTDIRILTTSTDVIHAFAIPAAAIKLDANPGKVNETWVRFNRPGVYYGQCSELCGVDHGFMPIAIEVVAKAAFPAWVARAKREFASNTGSTNTRVARLAE